MGEKTFTKLDISPEWASALAETAKQKIKIETAEVEATVEISSLKPDGIDQIKTALINAKTIKTPKDAKVDIYTIGAPKYRIEVIARDYSVAEKILQDAVNEALNSIRNLGGAGRQLD
jgi:translation initiation factor 2 subunit 1